METIAERILRLKKERNAVVLAHNYSLPDIQDVADFVGDSYGLSVKASETGADVIVFCGVSFMGETAKILNPSKKVLLPEPDALCAMASMCTSGQIADAKIRNPGSAVVGYVNSTADAKAAMDVCCTSANAVKIVGSLSEKNIIFVPDANLGNYVASCLPEKNIIRWDGYCPVHQAITADGVREMKSEHPGAKVIAHPECRAEVLEIADMIGSTEKMLKYCKLSDNGEFIVATEIGMKHRLEKELPNKRFYFQEHAICSCMKMTDLTSLCRCLENLSGEIALPENTMKKAYTPVKRMVDVK